jgi:carbamoyltransferase
MPPVILGLGGLLMDPSCCVLKDGCIAAAVEQSKVSRHERPGDFPDEAVEIALRVGQVKREEVTCVAVSRPFTAGVESAAHLELLARFPNSEIVVVEHHVAHAASAYYLSGFDSATVLSLDRGGDFRSGVVFRAEGNQMAPVRELYFPDSLGVVYNRVTELLGFESRADEHKVQWLGATLSAAPEASDLEVFHELLHRGGSMWPQVDRGFLDPGRLADGGFNEAFYRRLKLTAFAPVPAQRRVEIAAALQQAINETVAGLAGSASHVCLAGGLGLNSLLVAHLESAFPHVFVQPAAGNAGTALGAALHAWHHFYGEQTRVPFKTLCLGPEYRAEEIKQVIENCKLRGKFLLTDGELVQTAIAGLSENKIVAWMHGRMEFGPRALGNRSILASPLNPYSTENLNVYIKHREGFRKFAASVPAEVASEYFEVGPNARFLATVGHVRPKYQKAFEAATLGRNLVRVHTVSQHENPRYHALLEAAGAATGLPVLYNTSFNLFGDPLVCTPRDAVRSFYSSGIDALFAGNFYLEK